MSEHEERRVGLQHQPDGITLPIHGPDFPRPDPALVEPLRRVSSATASAGLHCMGVRQTFIDGPVSRLPGNKIVGSAVPFFYMGLYRSGGREYNSLLRHHFQARGY